MTASYPFNARPQTSGTAQRLSAERASADGSSHDAQTQAQRQEDAICRIAESLWGPAKQVDRTASPPYCTALRVTTQDDQSILLKSFVKPEASSNHPSADHRFHTALHWHQFALDAQKASIPPIAPTFFALHDEANIIGIHDIPGNTRTLASLHANDQYLDQLADGDLGALEPVLSWLGAFHDWSTDLYFRVSNLSDETKKFICDRYFAALANSYPSHLRPTVRSFIDYYMDDDGELVHGATDHVVLSAAGPVAIDFEYGHFGQGMYDVACLLRDFIVSILRNGQNPDRLMTSAWTHYAQARQALSSTALDDLNAHLSLQAMNSLHGPASERWAGQLSDKQRARIAGWSIAMLPKRTEAATATHKR